MSKVSVSSRGGLGGLARTMFGLAMKGVKSVNCAEDSCVCVCVCVCVCALEVMCNLWCVSNKNVQPLQQ